MCTSNKRQCTRQYPSEITDLPEGCTCTIDTGERALAPSLWQDSAVVVTSLGDKGSRFPGEKGARPLLWDHSVQDLSKSLRCTLSPGSAHPRTLPHRNSCPEVQRCSFETSNQITDEIAGKWEKYGCPWRGWDPPTLVDVDERS